MISDVMFDTVISLDNYLNDSLYGDMYTGKLRERIVRFRNEARAIQTLLDGLPSIFVDAQEKKKLHPDTFYAPDLSDLEANLQPGDLIKVCETDADGDNGEGYWIKVTGIDWPTIHGTVDNVLISQDREPNSELTVEATNVFDSEHRSQDTGTEKGT